MQQAKLNQVQSELTAKIEKMTQSKQVLETSCSEMESMTMQLSEQVASLTKERDTLKADLTTAQASPCHSALLAITIRPHKFSAYVQSSSDAAFSVLFLLSLPTARCSGCMYLAN